MLMGCGTSGRARPPPDAAARPGSRRPPPHGRDDPQALEVQAGSGGDDSDRGPCHRVRTLPPIVTGVVDHLSPTGGGARRDARAPSLPSET